MVTVKLTKKGHCNSTALQVKEQFSRTEKNLCSCVDVAFNMCYQLWSFDCVGVNVRGILFTGQFTVIGLQLLWSSWWVTVLNHDGNSTTLFPSPHFLFVSHLLQYHLCCSSKRVSLEIMTQTSSRLLTWTHQTLFNTYTCLECTDKVAAPL